MSPATRSHVTSVLLLLLLGCSGDPTGPSGSGTLSVTVQGLPSGAAAAVSVSGPAGYSQSLTGSQTFTGLAPGVYTVTASDVTVGTAPYQASPPSQTVTVVQSGSPGTASITYTTPTGNLGLTISGLGTSTAAVTVTGPGGYTQAVGGTTNLTGLIPGAYTVAARDTTATGGTMHTASPSSQPVTITAQMTANANVTYTPPPSNGSVNLHVAGMYLTQSAQDFAGSIPLVENRDGFLRVFVVADRVNAVGSTTAVQVRLYNGATLLSTILIPHPPGLTSVPTAVDESSLSYSWNTPVPGTQIQPGLRIEAEVNPAPRVVVETDTTDNLLGPLPSTVQKVPRVDVTFVPVMQRGNNLLGRVTAARKDSFLLTTKKMHPIDSVVSSLHLPYTTTTTKTLDANNSNGAWGTILGEIDAIRVTEASPRYYYGIARVSYTSGVAGVAYVSLQGTTPGSGARAALGWDYLPSGSIVAAHELAHNWGRNHAPCGGPAAIDPNYPHSDGSTGSWGVDVSTQTLEPASLSDIMGYCDPKWISNYTYQGVFNYLLAPSPPFLGSVASQSVQPCLMVWGHILDGELVLEPAFQVNTRPSLPTQAGPYSLEGRASDGSPVFSLSFAPSEIADAPGDQQNFVFAVPLPAARASRLTSLHLSGNGRPAILAATTAVTGAQAATQPDTVEVRRVGGGRVSLRWDARAHPMVMVRDAETGEVLSLARGGDAELSTLKGQVDLVMSDGVKSRVKRVAVAR
jgi:hypothetical protein